MQALRLVSTQNLSHEEWMYYRNSGITGSRIAGIMGESPYDTPLSIYLEMTGQMPQKEQSESMYFGTVLEDFISWEFANRSGLQVRKVEAILQHPVYDIFLANVDREIVGNEPGILECKNQGEYSFSEWKDGAPRHYYLQLQWYLGVTGYTYGYIAALVGGNKFINHLYKRDDDLIETMYERANDFWYMHIEPQIPPDARAGDLEPLKALYPRHEEGKVLDLTDEDSGLVSDLWEADTAVKESEKLWEFATIKMQEKMQDAESVRYNGQNICTWKADKNGKKTFKLKR